MGGWTIDYEIDKSINKCVVIGAPHTSNWDFIYFFGLTNSLGINSYWIGKDTLFKWPFGDMMRRLGGIPVDRAQSQNMVDTMAKEFEKRDDFILTIPPEGTRGSVRQWRTGFYYIALKAKVPLIIGMMDYAKKTGGLGPEIALTGDYDADMAKVSEYYHQVTPRYPDKAMKDIVSVEPDLKPAKEKDD